MGKIAFAGKMCVEHKVLERNMRHARKLGLEYLKKPPAKEIAFHDRKLAVVGGGHSVSRNLYELRNWDGEIWAINGACTWLRNHGIESTLFTIDPLPVLAEKCAGAKKAIISTRCDPALFKALEGAHVRIFDVAQDRAGGFLSSCGSVLTVPDLATDLGFKDIHFFGCEGSFEGDTHLYMNDPQDFRFVVSCGGKEYMTLPELYVLTVEVAKLLKAFSNNFHDRSGGLLGALIQNPEHDIVKVSRRLLEGLKEAA